jgi:CDP-glucose 4,6-dehydratase
MAIGKSSLEDVVDAQFWQGKHVLVTGHTGFKGAWLCLWLQQLGAKLTGFAQPHKEPSLFEDANVTAGMRSITGDIRNFAELRDALDSTGPQIVFHLAAQSLVRRSYLDPVETYATNVLGTVHLLEALRRTGGVRAMVNITSDKCYENQGWAWGYREDDRLGGHDPYSASKAAAEIVTSSYRASFFSGGEHACEGVALASARAGNVIGGGDWADDRLIPDVVRALMAGQQVHLRNPHSVRPWQHVLDPLAGYMLLAQRLYTEGSRFASAWNFGPMHQDPRSVSWIVDYFLSKWGSGESWAADTSASPHEAHYLKLDTSKAISELGWKPRWDIGTALEATVEWYKARKDGNDMRRVTLRQIASYTSASACASV